MSHVNSLASFLQIRFIKHKHQTRFSKHRALLFIHSNRIGTQCRPVTPYIQAGAVCCVPNTCCVGARARSVQHRSLVSSSKVVARYSSAFDAARVLHVRVRCMCVWRTTSTPSTTSCLRARGAEPGKRKKVKEDRLRTCRPSSFDICTSSVSLQVARCLTLAAPAVTVMLSVDLPLPARVCCQPLHLRTCHLYLD